ncbi:hypothetical protein BHE97_16585 [Aeromicrobium sp. PE09-221]|uniref:hypothetical protein n=1 Tax=Aeromicrobium sp. PE09-221 TaxID=1898043 RepID=UPI000B3E61FE|nr:hypothetical protein [Aeromicrobium sp. PE09-221]OUZ07562.1 hypothetical protein BHE97_16585 [Aeromicrobium sp. PE09-221]
MKTVRKPLPMSSTDLTLVQSVREDPAYREALAAASGRSLGDHPSEASVLRAIFEAGAASVREHVEAVGYAELGAQRGTESRRIARRRRPAWADED